jgi:hypothetical protein
MNVLRVVREVDPPEWVVGSGVIRNAVWDRLHGFDTPASVRDVDVAYFDERDVRRERDQEVARRLGELRPEFLGRLRTKPESISGTRRSSAGRSRRRDRSRTRSPCGRKRRHRSACACCPTTASMWSRRAG